MDNADKPRRFQQYIEALEEERRKIQVFHRELPFCLQLVTQAIDACRQQLSQTATTTSVENESPNGQSECSVQTAAEEEGRAIEESVPVFKAMTRPSGSGEDNNKSDWLRSAQLWNQTPDQPSSKENDDSPTNPWFMDGKGSGSGAAFRPLREEKKDDSGRTTAASMRVKPATANSPVSDKAGVRAGRREEKEGDLQRKSRRCWSPELHRRFLQSLQQLGGAYVATPKLIRELMKVDGLTNDEVKSHLQKYRLHSRRLSGRPTIQSGGGQQAPQLVVVGGLWVPPPQEAAAAPAMPMDAEETGNHSDGGGGLSSSQTTSSSIYAATTAAACPAF